MSKLKLVQSHRMTFQPISLIFRCQSLGYFFYLVVPCTYYLLFPLPEMSFFSTALFILINQYLILNSNICSNGMKSPISLERVSCNFSALIACNTLLFKQSYYTEILNTLFCSFELTYLYFYSQEKTGKKSNV